MNTMTYFVKMFPRRLVQILPHDLISMFRETFLKLPLCHSIVLTVWIVNTIFPLLTTPMINAVSCITGHSIFNLVYITSSWVDYFHSWWSCEWAYGTFFSHTMSFTAFFPSHRRRMTRSWCSASSSSSLWNWVESRSAQLIILIYIFT